MNGKSVSFTYVARRAGQDFYHLFEAESGCCLRSVNVPRNATGLVNGSTLPVTEPSGRITLPEVVTGRWIRSL